LRKNAKRERFVSFKVEQVESRREFREFVDVAHRVYRSDPCWVPKLNLSMMQLLSATKNPFHREAAIVHFLVRDREGTAVGRIAGVIHPAYVKRHSSRAFFGFFESEPNQAVACALLDAVQQWAWDHGFRTIAGPYSYSSSEEVGILVEGFGVSPALLQGYNPPYYEDLLRCAGFEAGFETSTYTMDRATYRERMEAIIARGERVRARNGFSVRSIDMSHYDEELETLRQLYNRSFAEHPEFVPISRAVFGMLTDDLKTIMVPRLTRVIEKDGAPVAFSILVPNLNEVLAGRGGKISPSLILQGKRLFRQIHSIVVATIGAVPEFFGQGLGRCIVGEIAQAIISGQYDTVHTTSIDERNALSRALVGYLEAHPTKRYAVFERTM